MPTSMGQSCSIENSSLLSTFIAAEMDEMADVAAPPPPLRFAVLATCTKSKARASRINLPHSVVLGPVFMPVGTKGTLKGMLPEQVKDVGVQLCKYIYNDLPKAVSMCMFF